MSSAVIETALTCARCGKPANLRCPKCVESGESNTAGEQNSPPGTPTDPPENPTFLAAETDLSESTPTDPPENPTFLAAETDLSESEKRSLDELKDKVQGLAESQIYGVPLLADERADVILLKFLGASDFKVEEAFSMLDSTLKWRREMEIDILVEEDLGDDLNRAVFSNGFDKDGRPVCYVVLGKVYKNSLGDQEKKEKFLKRRIQVLERSIRQLSFSAGGNNTIFEVNDLEYSPSPLNREHRKATEQASQLLEDNYPNFVAGQVKYVA